MGRVRLERGEEVDIGGHPHDRRGVWKCGWSGARARIYGDAQEATAV